MDRIAVVQGVTDTLYDYCTFGDEARLDDFVDLFCEDCRFGRFESVPGFGSWRLPC